jgi:hypothetical protein
MKRSIFLAGWCLLFMVYGCEKDKDENQSLLYGPEIAIGNGKARSFIKTDSAGNPARIGLLVSEAVINSLPHHDTSLVIPMPNGNKTLTDHITFEWNPHGHEPDHLYDVPHFDVHFYMIPLNEQKLIDPASSAMEKLPSAEFVPQPYIPTPGGVPQMGKHWVDPTSGEFNGQPFTSTFIYGSWDGKFHFAEPMFAQSFLESKPNFFANVSPLPKVLKSGFYPAAYSIQYDAGSKQYSIALEELKFIAAQ